MTYNIVNGQAVKNNDILVLSQLKESNFRYLKKTVNAKNTGTTSIAITDAGGLRFHPTMVRIVLSGANAVTLVPTISIGTNDSTYNNIFAATSLVGMTTVNNMNNFLVAALVSSVAGGTDIKINVSVGATATQCDLDVFVFGDYA